MLYSWQRQITSNLHTSKGGNDQVLRLLRVITEVASLKQLEWAETADQTGSHATTKNYEELDS